MKFTENPRRSSLPNPQADRKNQKNSQKSSSTAPKAGHIKASRLDVSFVTLASQGWSLSCCTSEHSQGAVGSWLTQKFLGSRWQSPCTGVSTAPSPEIPQKSQKRSSRLSAQSVKKCQKVGSKQKGPAEREAPRVSSLKICRF